MILTNEQLINRLVQCPPNAPVVFLTMEPMDVKEFPIATLAYDKRYNRVVMSDLDYGGDDIEEEEGLCQ